MKSERMSREDLIAADTLPPGTREENSSVSIESMIITVRDRQVILNRDLAKLYGVETKVLNQAVKRNIERFPEDFMFQLSMDECSRSQFVTLNGKRGQNIKYLPYAFTENGIAMLSSVLRSPVAIATNIQIMRIFTKLRQAISANGPVLRRLELVEFHHLALLQNQLELNKQVAEIFNRLDQEKNIPIQGVFYEGQIFDAYTFASDLIKSATESIVLIDNYIDESVLLMLSKRKENVHAMIVTRKFTETLRLDLERHRQQYPPIEVQERPDYHDRFLIIDGTVYHLGASLKDLGKRLFAFSKLELPARKIL